MVLKISSAPCPTFAAVVLLAPEPTTVAEKSWNFIICSPTPAFATVVELTPKTTAVTQLRGDLCTRSPLPAFAAVVSLTAEPAAIAQTGRIFPHFIYAKLRELTYLK